MGQHIAASRVKAKDKTIICPNYNHVTGYMFYNSNFYFNSNI